MRVALNLVLAVLVLMVLVMVVPLLEAGPLSPLSPLSPLPGLCAGTTLSTPKSVWAKLGFDLESGFEFDEFELCVVVFVVIMAVAATVPSFSAAMMFLPDEDRSRDRLEKTPIGKRDEETDRPSSMSDDG